MTTTTLDCLLLRDVFGSARMRALFDTTAMLQGWLDAEVALAEVQAERGIIPPTAVEPIRAACDARRYDLDALRAGMSESQHPLVPTLRAVAHEAGPAGQYLHWGATTQDILDTGLVLQLRRALDLLDEVIGEACAATALLADRHRGTVMAGRTHAQHAVPITFGLKAATWLVELVRGAQRLEACRPRVLLAQLGGAAGTLGSLGGDAMEVRSAFAWKLRLGVAPTTWHTARDGLAETAAALAMLAATSEKIAREVVRLQSTEIGELSEPLTDAHVGSSTMPQKRNPMVCEQIAAMAKIVRGLSPVMTSAMVVEHERDMAAWAAEWLLVPQLMIVGGGVLEKLNDVLGGLVVRPERMRENVELTRGAIMAEAVMLGVGRTIGRERAHDLMSVLTRRADERGVPLREIFEDAGEVADVLDERELDELFEPERYIGAAGEMVDAALTTYAAWSNARSQLARRSRNGAQVPG